METFSIQTGNCSSKSNQYLLSFFLVVLLTLLFSTAAFAYSEKTITAVYATTAIKLDGFSQGKTRGEMPKRLQILPSMNWTKVRLQPKKLK